MYIRPTEIAGCSEIVATVREDARGLFAKTFQASTFRSAGLRTDFVEDFYSRSRKGVLRGLHFQIPPRALVKLVSCVQGSVWDVVLDLRRGSPTYRKHIALELSARKANMIYVPEGLAHGFYATSDEAVLMYKTTEEHSPTHDSGIRWDSADISWPGPAPVVSERDSRLPVLDGYESPFVFADQK